ncbi:MAG: helix-hairpin-helix domain-containing protein [Deltaproteobacteria bacterium]|nr:helix-hairpin-helix domain-containing protein [Deltaproteobacteria bacterium]
MKRLFVHLLAMSALHAATAGAVDVGAGPPDQGPPSVEQDPRININEAPPEELVKLPGIGPSRAEAIVAEREKRRFRRIEDIIRVPGIGRKTFGRIRHSIRVR